MSILLYVLAINELLVNINNNVLIRGFEFTVTKRNTIKILAYADDTSLLLRDVESIFSAITEFEKWGEESGARLNKEKSSILAINPTNEHQEIAGILVTQKFKILGVLFDQFVVKIRLRH